RQPRAERRPGLQRHGADASKTVILEDPEPDLIEEFAGPTLLMREIAELAGDRAYRTFERAGCSPGEKVGQIEEMPGLGESRRFAPGEPDKFRNLHFWRHRAADIPQRVVAAFIDACGVLGCAVIHPDDDVALGRVGWTDGKRTTLGVEHDK